MIPFTTVSKKFELELKPHFAALLCEHLASDKYENAHAGHKQLVLDELKKNNLPLIGLKDMLVHRKRKRGRGPENGRERHI